MTDLLVRGVNEQAAERLREKAKRQGRSLNDLVKETLEASVAENRAELWARIDALRESLPPSHIDSTDFIREDRDR